MPYCTKCGANVSENAGFCPTCGSPQTVNAASPSSPAPSATTSGLSENSAGALCYVLGWLTGLIFYLTDKRPYVRFHAAQSIVLFGSLHILEFVFGIFLGFGMYGGGLFAPHFALFHLIQLVSFILWILCMVKAYQGERFRVPFAADLAERLFGKS